MNELAGYILDADEDQLRKLIALIENEHFIYLHWLTAWVYGGQEFITNYEHPDGSVPATADQVIDFFTKHPS